MEGEGAMRFAVFFATWFCILGLAYWYVGRRLIRPISGTPGKKRVFWWLILSWYLLPIIPFLFFLSGVHNSLIDLLTWIGQIGLGSFTLILTFVAARDLALLFRKIWDRLAKVFQRPTRGEATEFNAERRQFFVHSTNIGILGAVTVLTGYGMYEARRRADIEEITIPLVNLPKEFEGFRIVQFTDLHAGPTIKRAFVEGIAEQVDALKGDCLVFTGDLIDGSVAWLKNDVAPLRDLSAPFGKFFITGNHEYYSGVIPWIEEAGRLGFDVLLNEHRVLQRGAGRIVLAGVTDYSAGDFISEQTSSAASALAQSPAGLVRIVLAHQPRSVYDVAAAGADLQISGHTHGGQFFPWNRLATFNQPFIKGLHKYKKTWVYVSRGTGYWGPPIRIGIPPEITVLRLTNA